jgi:hypothetical protein
MDQDPHHIITHRHLSLTIQHERCDQKMEQPYRTRELENETGITVGDLFSVMWSTNLKCNMGLYPR